MHSHDRTLLAKLGFSDSDKKDPKHDWACQYLCQPDVGETLLKLLTFPELSDSQKAAWNFNGFAKPGFRTEVPISKGEGQYKTTIGFLDVLVIGRRLFISQPFPELAALMKKVSEAGGKLHRSWSTRGDRWEIRDGGYHLQPEIDRLAPQVAAIYRDDPSRSYTDPITVSWTDDSTWTHSCPFRVFVEVKIAPTATGDILRQMQFYREYGNCSGLGFGEILLLVLTAFPLQDGDIATLKAEGVHHAKLGKAFEDYCARRRANSASTASNVEL